MKHRTEIVFILDKSGSMFGLEKDTIGGFNSMLEKQQAEEGEALLTTVLFDSGAELLHDRVPIRSVRPMTEAEYYVGGNTALLDAVGSTIRRIDATHRKENAPEKTIFIITTDGMENASTEYNTATVKKMIEEKKKEGWEFLFLGANIDTAEAASRIGISKERAASYHADSKGTQLNFKVLNKAVSAFRRNEDVSEDWKKEIDKDFSGRTSKR